MRKGFTLIELLLVVGIIGIISSIVIIAINPFEMLGAARDAERKHSARELTNAEFQYLIDKGRFATDKSIPEGEANAKPICRFGQSDPGCINVDELVADYVACIPYDGMESNSLYTGYSLYQVVGRTQVRPDYLGEENKGGGCENAQTIAEATSSSASNPGGGSMVYIRRRIVFFPTR